MTFSITKNYLRVAFLQGFVKGDFVKVLPVFYELKGFKWYEKTNNTIYLGAETK